MKEQTPKRTDKIRLIRKKRHLVVISWILFTIIACTLLFFVIHQACHKEARKELQEQTDIIEQAFSSIVQNDFYTRVSTRKTIISKLKTLAFALEPYTDQELPRQLVEDFVAAADIETMSILDRNGNIIFGPSNDLTESVKQFDIPKILDEQSYKAEESVLEDQEFYQSNFLVENYFGEDNDLMLWGIGTQWLVLMQDHKSDNEFLIESFFDWKEMIRQVTVGRTGFLLAVENADGTVLSAKDFSMEGNSIADYGISLDEFARLKGKKRTVETVLLNGENYYASLIEQEEVTILSLMPFDDIFANVISTAGIICTLFFLITGVCMVYVYLHIGGSPDEGDNGRLRFIWNQRLSKKLVIVGALALIVLFGLGMCLEILLSCSNAFRYSASKAATISEQDEKSSIIVPVLHNWFDEVNLTRCNIAAAVLTDTKEQDIDWEYLDALSYCLNVNSITVFDENGTLVLTNSDYDQMAIDENSKLYPLMQGRPYLITEIEHDEVAGEYQQYIGVTLHDDNHKRSGVVMIVADATQLNDVFQNFDYDRYFEQAALTNETFVAVILEEDQMLIKFVHVQNDEIRVEDPSLINFNMSQLAEKRSGDTFIFSEEYCSAISKHDGVWILVMKSWNSQGFRLFLPVVYATVAAFIYLLLLYILSCAGEHTEEIYEEEAEEPMDDSSKKRTFRDAEILSMFDNILNKNKPLFEERWPDDSKTWTEKTANEKFKVVLKIVLVSVLALIAIYATIAGEASFWYYCIHSKWNNGVNINSIAFCIACICLLIVLKMVIHKLLYLAARATGPKGETICHLMNSFSSYFLFFAAIFLCLGILGVNLKTLSLTGGVAGVVFGIGCQNIVADILAGILMTFEGVVHVGDLIAFNGNYAVVKSIGIRTTTLSWYNEDTIVRNNDLKNYIYIPNDKERRLKTTLNIGLEESIERIMAVIEKELPEIQARLSEAADNTNVDVIFRGVDSIKESYIVLAFYIFCEGIYYRQLEREMNRQLKQMCERNNIKIAIPQIEVHTPLRDADSGDKR